jgi:hypothetical protein
MLDLLIIILVLAWLGGWGFNLAGSLIHLLLVIAFVVLLVRIIRGQRL